MSALLSPGSIVKCRNREWVLLPGEDETVHRLRPLTGATDEVVALHRALTDLIGYDLPNERITSATFPLPTVDDVADAASAHLLWQASRLTLREGATPFRSLGRVSIRPRIYQFVPLLMALRLDPVRMLIADDVGVGKTIEALLVARELLDRGEIKRICVLCPPYLCDQWQKELSEKFNLDAVIVRSGTIGQLERRKLGAESVYRCYPVQVVSIDFVKSERNRHIFLQDCPEFVIVDEAHGSAVAAQNNENQHQRHRLLRDLAETADRHLLLLTATPHSGVASAFASLLALLDPEFGTWDTANLNEAQRIALARHFVQRTRADIERDWEGEHCFPKREGSDAAYALSPAYQNLFKQTYDFCAQIVQSGQSLDQRRQRVRYWGALALLRCVMSSPAAAVAALGSRHYALPASEDEPDYRAFIYESDEDQSDDEQPTPMVEGAAAALSDSERKRLRELGRAAQQLHESTDDTKLGDCEKLVADLLRAGFHPIIWCRYIATAEYVASALQKKLSREHPNLRVLAISGRLGDEERREKIKELAQEARRILVATDCLSEGVNLQHAFNAVLHYDLPWNPNRLEQREGRVDRYGQIAPIVKAIRYYGNSAVDGIVLDVLLNKAREIHRTLGTHVPVPKESENVTNALLNALFLRGRTGASQQMQLDLGPEATQVKGFHESWERDAEREKVNRTRFAQRALKPAEVRDELDATDSVLGDPQAVREFVLNAAQRLSINVVKDKQRDAYKVGVGATTRLVLPDAIKLALPETKSGQWLISFVSPTPEGAEYLGRNHGFVAALARYLMEEALIRDAEARASRCGVLRTNEVSRTTVVLLLRVRYLIHQPGRAALLSEEVVATGYVRGEPRQWFEQDDEALKLLASAKPIENVPMAEKRELVQSALHEWTMLEPALKERLAARGQALEESHKRVRRAVDPRGAQLPVRNLTVAPQFPPDLLGLLVLQPIN